MSRELRRVSGDWEHPKKQTAKGQRYVPLFDGALFSKHMADWKRCAAEFERAPSDSLAGMARDEGLTYSEWDVPAPSKDDYMPVWDESELTHFMWYETTSEGTPISDVKFTSRGAAAKYAFENGFAIFGKTTASLAVWIGIANKGCLDD